MPFPKEKVKAGNGGYGSYLSPLHTATSDKPSDNLKPLREVKLAYPKHVCLISCKSRLPYTHGYLLNGAICHLYSLLHPGTEIA